MKKILMSFAVMIFTITGFQAQESKTVKEESTIKRVVTKEGSDVKIKEIKSTLTETGEVIVAGNDETNQEFSETTSQDSNEKVVDEINIDKKNKAMVAIKKEQQQMQLESSIKAQKEAAAAAAEKIRQEKLQQQQKELEARRAALTKRPDGMAKLKKE
ncbi:hypothetical protein [Aequorivita sp. Q41]|uniref:hypothetical protein n=1 Tax=Aequorivita sp. Q41 TaxID=3153300 RepID=UPI003242747A